MTHRRVHPGLVHLRMFTRRRGDCVKQGHSIWTMSAGKWVTQTRVYAAGADPTMCQTGIQCAWSQLRWCLAKCQQVAGEKGDWQAQGQSKMLPKEWQPNPRKAPFCSCQVTTDKLSSTQSKEASTESKEDGDIQVLVLLGQSWAHKGFCFQEHLG